MGGGAEPPARLSRGSYFHPRSIIAGSAGRQSGAGTALLTKGKADPSAGSSGAGRAPSRSTQPRAKHFACAAEPQSRQAWPRAAGLAAAATAEHFGSGLFLRLQNIFLARDDAGLRAPMSVPWGGWHGWAAMPLQILLWHRRCSSAPPPPLQPDAALVLLFFKPPSVSRRRFVA